MRTLSLLLTPAAVASLGIVLGACSAAGGSDPVAPSEDEQSMQDALTIARPIAFGEIKVATLGCTPTCAHVGTSSEGWYDGCWGTPIKYGKCQDEAAVCNNKGTRSEGWYTVGGELIRWDNCAQKTGLAQYEAYTFDGKAGQTIDIWVDGLLQRADGSLSGIDTRVRLFNRRGFQLAMNDDTTESPWTVRMNEAANPKSSSLLRYVLPEDGLYIVLVDAKKEQGSAEVVVKTASEPLCAVAVIRPEGGPTYDYVHNFTSTDEAEQWLAGFQDVVSTQVEPQACNEPRICPAVVKPVCGVVLYDEPRVFNNACEFLAAVGERAGSDGESKGYYYDGECPQTWCATVTISGGNSPTFYAKNFGDKKSAEQWQESFPDRYETSLDPTPCDVSWNCAQVYEPVCGTVFYEAPATYSNDCAFKNEVRARAGSDSEAKGFWTAGVCQPPADPVFCMSNEDCTATVYGKRVASADDCYCPMCPSSVVNLAEATARAEGWQNYCAGMDCPMPKCVQPPPAVCVNNACQFDFGNH